jgi:Uma2 family endonuclease
VQTSAMDPELELVTIYRSSASGFAVITEISRDSGGTITSPLFPGFALDVHEIFAE